MNACCYNILAGASSVDTATLVGSLATLASTTSFVPQAWKIIRTRDTRAISAGMYTVTVLGFALWLAYGLLLGAWPLIATNGICLALSAFILVMTLLPRRRREAVADALDPAA
jgi:MtN3 and saliva related transmembrane protein